MLKFIFYSAVLGFIIFFTQEKIKLSELFRHQNPRANAPVVQIDTIDLASSIRGFYADGTVMLDVRLKEYYDYGHIENALNLPPDTWEKIPDQFLVILRKAPLIEVYCDSTSCGSSFIAARKLIDAGLDNVKVYFSGWSEWRSCRLPMTMSTQMKDDIAKEIANEH